MKQDWLNFCLDLSVVPADFYAGGNRKIIRNRSVVFKKWKDDLTLGDSGYTNSKMTMLKKNYLHDESREVAKQLWEKRIGQRKYGSVSFTCFGHFVKGGSVDAKRSKRASVFGPCIQSVSLTYMQDHSSAVDVFYRTTELFKKFPADLVFIRDVLLADFNFSNNPLKSVTFHFANITCHPMYFVTILPLLEDPVGEFEEIRQKDKVYFDWIVKGTSRYLVPGYERGIQKFSQAMRVHKDANERLVGETKDKLIKYLIKHHPGFKKGYNSVKGQ